MAQKINQKQFVNVVKEAITKTLKESGFNGYDMQPQTPITKQQQIDASWQEFNDNNKNRLAQQQQNAKVGSYLDSNINADDLNGQLGMDAMSNDKDVADIAQMTKGTPRQTGQRYDNYLKQKYMESKKQRFNMTENQLNNIIKECITEVLAESTVKRVLTEMGTPAQNSLLRKLTGTNEYDNLSVSDASEKISSLLDKQNSNNKPSEKQLAFISRYNFAKGKDLTFLTKREASQIIQSLMARDITRAQRAFNAYYQQSMHNQFDNTLSNGNTPYLLHSSNIARLKDFSDTYNPFREEEFSKQAKRILDAFEKSKDKFVFCDVWNKERPYYWVFNTGNSIQFNKPIKVNVISPSDFGEVDISFYTWYIYLVDKDKGFMLRKPEDAERIKKLYGLV